jgi:OOP family OmpA-OmpF porin
MRNGTKLVLCAVIVLAVAASGCGPKRQWGTCAIAGGLVGGALGAVGGGVGVDQVQPNPNNWKRAAGAGGGFVAGGLVGALLGHYLCDPPVQAPPAPVAVVPPPPSGTEIFEIRGTHFAFDSDRITAEGKTILDQAVSVMNQHPSINVTCDGYTDSIGSEQYNMGLGQRRADSVAAYLTDQGISSGRITSRSFGESMPAASNDTEAGRAQNRRVEIVVD